MILSFENHCSTEQQKIVARYVKDIFGGWVIHCSANAIETAKSANCRGKGGNSSKWKFHAVINLVN